MSNEIGNFVERKARMSEIPCCKCGGEVVEFVVPNDLWNMVIRQDGHESNKEYLCFACWNNALYKYLEEMQQWVNDLQSGMYINCVYCGHRYGPQDKTPASMADILKQHIEKCPKYPMSKLKLENDALRKKIYDTEIELGEQTHETVIRSGNIFILHKLLDKVKEGCEEIISGKAESADILRGCDIEIAKNTLAEINKTEEIL
jgi:DNA-directed RNA polymerase subunit RPC12/RpoP